MVDSRTFPAGGEATARRRGGGAVVRFSKWFLAHERIRRTQTAVTSQVEGARLGRGRFAAKPWVPDSQGRQAVR